MVIWGYTLRYKNLENYTTEELKDLYDTLHMNKCRCMFQYETHKQYYDDIISDLNKISNILKSRSNE